MSSEAATGAAVRAAGGVLWRHTGGPTEIALVHRPRYDDWSLPKGKLATGEHPLTAGVREVVEETGIRPVLGRRLVSTTYPVSVRDTIVDKLVDYWAMRAESGDFQVNDEVDELRWLTVAKATETVSYRHDRAVLADFARIAAGTTTIVLVRHGSAGDRHQWRGDDRLRPLDPTGAKQAGRVAGVLPGFGPRRVISADKVRCTQTVRPLATVLGVPVEVDDDFGEERHARRPGHAAQLLRALAEAGEPVVICSQGGVIPDSVEELADADGVPLTDVPARKGSVWALSFAGRRLVSADYYRSLKAPK
ncbi:NUDIX hydrolase [Fodinicola acaciae]|uniref:NUDIX hydrolase n=1 Tax=Fodinicola acaciae TaxID=2681555 RepID=UPI001C9E9CE3|nr:NUDIX hydrolase [Fodinicola acaciae]